MSDQEQYGVGINFHLEGAIARELQKMAGLFDHLHQAAGNAAKVERKSESEAIKARKEQAKLAGIAARELAATNKTRLKGEAEIAAIQAKNGAKAVVALQKASQAITATQTKQKAGELALQAHIERIAGIKQRSARADETALTRLKGMEQSRNAANLMAAQRVNSEKMRTEILERRLLSLRERANKPPKYRPTGDEHAFNSMRGRFAGMSPTPGNYMGASQQAWYNSQSIFHGFNPSIHAAAEYNTAQAGFKTMGLSSKDNAEAFGAARTVAGSVRGVTMTQALENIKDLHNATKNLKESIELAPMFSKMVFAAQVNHHSSHKQIMDSAKAAELMSKGATPAEYLESFKGNLDLFTKVQNATLGRIGGSEQLNWVKTAGLSRLNLNKDALMTNAAMMQEMGGSRAGTAFMSSFQNLVFGRATVKSAQALMRHGLLNEKDVIRDKKGTHEIKGFKAGGLKDSQLFMENPYEWLEKNMIKPILNVDIKKYGKKQGQIRAMMELSEMMGNRTGLNLFGTSMLQFDNIMREKKLIKGANGIEGSYGVAGASYVGAKRQYDAAITNMEIRIGTIVLPKLTVWIGKLTDMLVGLAAWADKHPGLFKLGVGAVAGSGVAMAAGSVGLAGMAGIGMARMAFGGGMRVPVVPTMEAAEPAIMQAGATLGGRIGSVMSTRIGASMMQTLPGYFGTLGVVIGGLMLGWELGKYIGEINIGGKSINQWVTGGFADAIAIANGQLPPVPTNAPPSRTSTDPKFKAMSLHTVHTRRPGDILDRLTNGRNGGSFGGGGIHVTNNIHPGHYGDPHATAREAGKQTESAVLGRLLKPKGSSTIKQTRSHGGPALVH
jgi:hypothetical protein